MIVTLLVVIVLILLFGAAAMRSALGCVLIGIAGLVGALFFIGQFADYITSDGVMLTFLGFMVALFVFSLWDQADKKAKSERRNSDDDLS